MTWTTHRYRMTKIHVSERGPIVLAAYATHTRPPWEWVAIRRARWLDWLDGPRNVALLPDMAIRAGSGGSWQAARRRAEAACATQ